MDICKFMSFETPHSKDPEYPYYTINPFFLFFCIYKII